MIYLTLDEDVPAQRYITVDSGAFVLRLSSEEAQGIAIGILQLLGERQDNTSNVINIGQVTKRYLPTPSLGKAGTAD